jgi:hypothetical protein
MIFNKKRKYKMNVIIKFGKNTLTDAIFTYQSFIRPVHHMISAFSAGLSATTSSSAAVEVAWC